MIIFVLSVILGIAGIIPPEHFDGWIWAALIEIVLDLPAFIIISAIKNAFDKQKPKKPVMIRDEMNFEHECCPVCEEIAYGEYCWNCGQKLDWRE